FRSDSPRPETTVSAPASVRPRGYRRCPLHQPSCFGGRECEILVAGGFGFWQRCSWDAVGVVVLPSRPTGRSYRRPSFGMGLLPRGVRARTIGRRTKEHVSPKNARIA